VYNQLALVGNLGGIEAKALLDRVVIDTSLKKIYFIDLKTTGKPIHTFPYWYRKYDYDFQQTWYWLLGKRWVKECLEFVIPGEPEEYTIENLCVAIETIEPHQTGFYRMAPSLLQEAASRIKDAVDRLKWHRDRDNWDFTREEIEGDHTITIY